MPLRHVGAGLGMGFGVGIGAAVAGRMMNGIGRNPRQQERDITEVVCNECSTLSPEGARFCVGCAAPIVPQQCRHIRGSRCGCGALNNVGSRFCNQCASPLEQ
ncbi:MAG: hypothetical protein FWE45_01725 [Firmicutes bacterium]|nr:hypothetical protein [Bacillota bacterium]